MFLLHCCARLTERSGGRNLHGNLGRRRDGVVGVGEEARVHAARHGLAGRVERRLRHGVVLGQELEDDRVADGHAELVGLEDEAARAADLDGVAGAGRGDRGRLALLDGRGGAAGDGDGGGVFGAGRDGLGDGDLLGDGGGLGLAARVGPDDDDAATGFEVDAAAVLATVGLAAAVALDNGHAAILELARGFAPRVEAGGVGVAQSVAGGHGERRDGQSDGC